MIHTTTTNNIRNAYKLYCSPAVSALILGSLSRKPFLYCATAIITADTPVSRSPTWVGSITRVKSPVMVSRATGSRLSNQMPRDRRLIGIRRARHEYWAPHHEAFGSDREGTSVSTASFSKSHSPRTKKSSHEAIELPHSASVGCSTQRRAAHRSSRFSISSADQGRAVSPS